MSTTTAASTSLTRYPRWVWALTGLTAAYATYTIWNVFDNRIGASNTSGLHRRNAIRQHRRRSPQEPQPQQLSANMQALTQQPSSSDDTSTPFGTITAQVNDHESIYTIGPHPPTLQQLRQDFQLSGGTLNRIHGDMQHVLLDIIVERLVEPNAEALLNSCTPVYSSLLPLVEPLRERNIGDLLGLIHLLAGRGHDESEADAEGEWRFEQANVALAFARRCGVDVERGGGSRLRESDDVLGLDGDLQGLDGDLAETVVDSDEGGHAREPGQGIKGLLYTIAEEQAKRSAYIHRGTRCDSCGEFPIRGVRWHCINCPDYDLCSNCEAQSPSVHPRTHVFAKIKIPISTLAQPHEVHDLWYPGDSLRSWPALKVSLRKRLVSETGFEDVAMEAYYEQFTCIANVAYPDDPTEIHAAIDRRAFNKAMSSDKWPAPLEPNLLFDRMFSFYDTDNNSLIGFQEFVHGLAYLRQPPGYLGDKRKSMDRVLKGYDVDGDGLISRADFVRMFSAKYAVQRHIIRDVVAAEEAEIVAHTGDIVRSSQPISAAFTTEDVPYGERRIPSMKRPDEFGDMQVAVGGSLGGATLPDDREIWDGPTINSVATRYRQSEDVVPEGEQFTLRHAEEIRDRYNRVEAVPIPGVTEEEDENGDDGHQRYLVETDTRSSRGAPAFETAGERWRTDLSDAIAGGASGSRIPHQQSGDGPENGNDMNGPTFEAEVDAAHDDQGPFPDFILDRGRAYDVPDTERDFGREVLYQVIQEGINELLDPLFRDREKLAEDVRNTRVERTRWRKEIDDFAKEKRAFQEELTVGANIDPLLATALRSSEDQEGQAWPRGNGRPVNGDQSPLFVDTSSPALPASGSSPHLTAGPNATVQELDRQTAQLPEPADIAAEIRSRIQQQSQTLPTDDEGLEDLEFNIRQQPLDDLLASAGYSIASDSPVEERRRQDVEGDWTSDVDNDASLAAPVSTPAHETAPILADSDEHYDSRAHAEDERPFDDDRTFPQNRRDDEAHESDEGQEGVGDLNDGVETNGEEEAMHLSPSSPPTPLPPSSPDSAPSSLRAFRHQSAVRRHHRHSHHHSTSGSYEGNRTESLANDSDDDSDDDHLRADSSSIPDVERLIHYMRLDEEERRILLRGGPARLTFAEVEEICYRAGNAGLTALIEGWLEWAGF